MRIQYYDGKYSEDTNLGRNFYTYPWDHEIPVILNLTHKGNETWYSFDLRTIFSGNIFSKTNNNTFMLFLLFWCNEHTQGNKSWSYGHDLFSKIASKLRDKMAV